MPTGQGPSVTVLPPLRLEEPPSGDLRRLHLVLRLVLLRAPREVLRARLRGRHADADRDAVPRALPERVVPALPHPRGVLMHLPEELVGARRRLASERDAVVHADALRRHAPASCTYALPMARSRASSSRMRARRTGTSAFISMLMASSSSR